MNGPVKGNPAAAMCRDSLGVSDRRACCGAREVSTVMLRRILALSAIDVVREHFDACALATDDPDPCMVDAADLIDAARDKLARVTP